MNNFISLAQSLQPALFRIPLLGDTQCWDSYGRATTIVSGVAGPVWREDAKGFWFGQSKSLTAGGGALSIADAPELRVTSGTLFWTARNFQAVVADSGARIFSKRDGGGTLLDVSLRNPNEIEIYDGTNQRWAVSSALTNSHSVAIRYVSGAIPKLFVDGVYRVDFSWTIVPANDDAPVFLGNLYVAAQGSQRNDYGAFIWFNDALLGRPITDQEISQLHDAWESIISIKAPKRTISLPVQTSEVVTTTPLLHLAGPRTPTGLWPDISGNGRDGTISGRVTQTKGPKGVVQQGYGAGNPLIITAADAALNPSSITAHLAFKRNGRGEANSGVYFAINNNLVMCMELWDLNATTLCIGETYADGEKYWTFPVPNVALKPTLDIVLRYNRDLPATLAYVLVDGEAVTVTDFNVKVGARVANPAPRVSVLGRGDLVLDADGAISDVQVYGSLLSDAECRALYVAQALLNEQRLANRTDYPVSVAAVAAGGTCGPWRGLVGTFTWSDNGTQRELRCVTAGQFAALSSQVYGAWYLEFSKQDTSTMWLPIIGSAAIQLTSASFNGYILYLGATDEATLCKVTAGGLVNIATTPVGVITANTRYKLLVTRRPRDGYWVVWIRGGAYATWTNFLTGTDNTHTACAAMVGYASGVSTLYDLIADVTFFPQGSGLVPNEIPWLRD